MDARELLDAVVVELAHAERVLDKKHVASYAQRMDAPPAPRIWKGWNGETLAYEGLGGLKVPVAPLRHLLDGDQRDRASETLAAASPLFFEQNGNIILAPISTAFLASTTKLMEERMLSLDAVEKDLDANPEKCAEAEAFGALGWMPWQWEKFAARGIPPEFAGHVPMKRRFRAAQDVLLRWKSKCAA